MFKRLKTSIISLILVLLLAIPALSSTRALQFEILLNGILHPTTGAPLSAGVVTFFAAGTTTAKNAWTAKNKTGAITSATLDTAGQYQAYGDGEYKLVIKDSGGTTRYTIDNVRVQHPNYALVSKSAAYTGTPDDDFILVDTSGGNVTIKFETAANFTHPITIKNISTNDVVLDPDGSETIDGSATYTISSQYESTLIVSDGSNWSRTIDFPTATTSTAGKIEIATDAEAIAATATDKALVPSNLSSILSHKNLLINGGQRHAQRGASGSATFTDATNSTNADDSYLLDRWYILSDGNNIIDVSQQTLGGVSAQEHYVRLDIDTAQKKVAYCQIVENKNLKGVIGQTVSVSAEIQVSNATRLSDIRMVVLSFNEGIDTVTSDWVSAWAAEGAVPTPIANVTAENVAADLSVTTSWVRYEIENISIDTAGADNVAACIYQNNVATASATGDFLEITNFQLESGTVSTDFEYRDVGYELSLCQRYVIKSWDQGTVPGTDTDDGTVWSNITAVASADHDVQFPLIFTAMLGAPTVIVYDRDGVSGKVTMAAGQANGTVALISDNSLRISGSNGAAGTTRAMIFHYLLISEL